jgi:transposase InsO family protein
VVSARLRVEESHELKGNIMLSDMELMQYGNLSHSLSSRAKDYIQSTRSKAASRMVGSQAGKNICSSVNSVKMGGAVGLESRSPERTFFNFCEYDDDVIEYWDQPEPVAVVRTNKNGRECRGHYTPDALILTKSGPKVIEVKDSEFIEAKFAESNPDWTKNSSGEIRYLPAFNKFEEIGIEHEVFVYDHTMRYKSANVELLLESRTHDECNSEQLAKVTWAFSEQFYLTFSELRLAAGLDSCIPIISLIDRGILFADWDSTLFSVPDGCVVTRSEQLLPYALTLLKAGQISSCEDMESCHISSVPNHSAAESALNKLKIAESEDNSRSARRYRALIKKGEIGGLSPFQALIPAYHRSGNWNAKVPKKVKVFLDEYLHKHYLCEKGNSSIYRSHMAYRHQSRKHLPHEEPVSRVTFAQTIAKIPAAMLARATGGRRSGNSAEAPTNALKRNLKSQAPWQCAAIDHCVSDIWLVVADANGKEYVARPWITIMLDLYSSKVIGMAVSFNSPSRRSNAKVIRDCVKRHGRLPSEIITDRGADFTSVYFESLLAHYRVTYSLRPVGHSRYGSEIEGFFGEFKRQWLSQLPGYISNLENVRAVDGEFRPDKCAVLRPQDFVRHLREFLSWRDMKCRGVASNSPEFLFTNPPLGDHIYGRKVEFDDEFILATAVESKKYKIDFQRGLHIGGMWFWGEQLSSLQGEKRSVDVRLDPDNPHLVFALVRNDWVPCYSGRVNAYSAMDPVSQLVEGLLISEAKSSRQKAFDDAGDLAAGIIARMDEMSKSKDSTPVAIVDAPSGNDSASVFKAFASASVESVNLEFWEA